MHRWCVCVHLKRHWLPKPSTLNTNKSQLTKCTHVYAIWIWCMPLNVYSPYRRIEYSSFCISLTLPIRRLFRCRLVPFSNQFEADFFVRCNTINAAKVSIIMHASSSSMFHRLAIQVNFYLLQRESRPFSQTIKQLDDIYLCFSTRTYFSVLFYNQPINQLEWIYYFASTLVMLHWNVTECAIILGPLRHERNCLEEVPNRAANYTTENNVCNTYCIHFAA